MQSLVLCVGESLPDMIGDGIWASVALWRSGFDCLILNRALYLPLDAQASTPRACCKESLKADWALWYLSAQVLEVALVSDRPRSATLSTPTTPPDRCMLVVIVVSEYSLGYRD